MANLRGNLRAGNMKFPTFFFVLECGSVDKADA